MPKKETVMRRLHKGFEEAGKKKSEREIELIGLFLLFPMLRSF